LVVTVGIVMINMHAHNGMETMQVTLLRHLLPDPNTLARACGQ